MADRFRTDPDWEDIRVFVALARHGTLSGAARALAVNHATISRRVAALERTLGRKLVERRPDGYSLTAEGQRVLQAAGEMEAIAAALRRDTGGEGPTGLVRVNATPSLAQGFLLPRLPRLMEGCPALDIEIATDMRPVSLDRHETDIALRLGRPEDGDVVAKRLAVIGYGFYAHPLWRNRLAMGGQPHLIGFDEANAHLPEAVWLARHLPRARLALRLDSQSAQAIAAAAGAGIALLPHVLGRSTDGLLPCPLDGAPPSRDLWLIRRRTDGAALAIRAVSDGLVRLFREERALFKDD